MESKKLELIVFSGLFVILSILTFFVFEPFLRIIVLAIVLAVSFQPLYEWLVGFFNGGKSIVACFIVVISLIFLIIPILFFGLQIYGQAQDFFSLSQATQGHYIHAIEENVNTVVRHIIPTFSFSVADSGSYISTFVANNLKGLLSQTSFIFFQILFMLFLFFFFLRDGTKMLHTLFSLSPFEKEQNKEIITSVNATITSVIRGTLFVSLIRFVLIALAFYFLGIPNALLWGSIGGIIGAVPGFGTLFVVVPAFLYLLFYGNLLSAIGMALFGILTSFFIDNLLSVHFFHKGLDVPQIFILLSIIGGIIFFGPLGFIFGPIIFSLFISFVDIYKILVLKKS